MNMLPIPDIPINSNTNPSHTFIKPRRPTLNLQTTTIDSPDSVFSRNTRNNPNNTPSLSKIMTSKRSTLTLRKPLIDDNTEANEGMIRKKLLFDSESFFDLLGSSTINTSRNHHTIAGFLLNNTNNQTDQNNLTSTRKGTVRKSISKYNSIILSHKPRRKVFKNTDDLFNQTLNMRPNKNNKEITNQLLLQTQIRILKRRQTKKDQNDKLPQFTSTLELNNYLIGQYHLGNNPGENGSKRKMTIAKDTYERIIDKEKRTIRKRSNNMKLLQDHKALLQGVYNDDCYTGRDNEDYSDDKMKISLKNYYDNKIKETQGKVEMFMDKLGSISRCPYEKLDKANLVNYHNLSRVIKLQKIKEKTNMTYDPIKKNQLKEDEDKVILATSKFGRPIGTKAKVRNDTQRKFNCIQGAYFGVPV